MEEGAWWWRRLVSFLGLLSQIAAFNLDTAVPVFKYGDVGTLFGYSVAVHKISDQDSPFEGTPYRLLVGAPKAESGQEGTREAGALFSCPFNTVHDPDSTKNVKRGTGNLWCKKEPVEYRAVEKSASERAPGSNLTWQPEDFYKYDSSQKGSPSQQFPGKRFYTNGKDGQLLGASVSSGGVDGSRAVVCAPLARFEESAHLDGVCYLLKNNLEQDIYIHSCMNAIKKERFQDYGACAEGISATISQPYQTLVTGLTGAKNWKGGLSARGLNGGPLLDSTTSFDGFEPLSYIGFDSSQVDPFPLLSSDSHLGYSTGLGRFGFTAEESGQDRVTVVGGATRMGETGAVVFSTYDRNDYRFSPILRRKQHLFAVTDEDGQPFRLSGRQVGGSFGAAIAVVDMDSDGFDDLLVGAPYEWEQDKETKRESGGFVYVFFAKGGYHARAEDVFHEPILLRGPSKHSQFGLAIAALGDINSDDLVDFAVGAPNQDDGQGAVYIFHGARRETFLKDHEPAQVVKPSELSGQGRAKPLTGFGFSLSGGVNVDDEAYADLLVGSVYSDAAVLLRTRPMIFIKTGLRAITQLDKDSNPCDRDGHPWAQTCVRLSTRLELEERQTAGKDVSYNQHRFQCKLEVLPSKTGLGLRAEFDDHLYERVWDCGRGIDRAAAEDEFSIYIPTANRDWLNDLKFRFNVSFRDERQPQPSTGLRPSPLSDYPVLDLKNSYKDLIVKFNKKCGADEKCVSDLQVSCLMPNLPREEDGSYVQHVGNSTRSLQVQFVVVNGGERAYDSQLFVNFDGEELEQPTLKPGNRLVSLGATNTSSVGVNLGNPLPETGRVEFQLNFDLYRGRSAAIGRPLIFTASANSTSEEANEDDNGCTLSVRVIKKAELRVTGSSTPSTVLFGGEVKGESTMEFEEDIGPHVYHNYTVTNDGPWGVNNLTVEIDWPYEVKSPFKHGKWALYLMERPFGQTWTPFAKDGKNWRTSACTVSREVEVVNPLELKLNTIYSVDESVVAGPRRPRWSLEDEEEEEEIYTREKRQLREMRLRPEIVTSGKESIKVLRLSCEDRTAKCARVRCTFPFLEPRQHAQVVLRSRLWNSTFVQHYYDVHEVLLHSNARLLIDPKQGVQEENLNDNTFSIRTKAIPDRPQIAQVRSVPYWIIVLAVIGGIFLLFLIVLLCWKCGFFKRERRHENQLYKAEFHHGEEEWTET